MVSVPKKPYILQYGKYFQGKSLEELPFLPGRTFKRGGKYFSGYQLLCRFIGESKSRSLVEHAKTVKSACDAKKPVVFCQCGNHFAQYVWVSSDDSGSTISFDQSARYADECSRVILEKVEAKLIPLEFSSIALFKNPTERRKFIELLEFCLFGSWDFAINSQSAFDYLFKNILPVKPTVQLELF